MKNAYDDAEDTMVDGDEHLVFKEIYNLFVRRPRVVAEVEQPGSGETVSFRVLAEVGSREAALMVRIQPQRGSYACWCVRETQGAEMNMLGTFGAGEA